MRPVQSDPYVELEATMLRQLLKSSGVFKAGGFGANVTGGDIRADMFIETLAKALAKSGAFGVADTLREDASMDGAAQLSRSARADAGPLLTTDERTHAFGRPKVSVAALRRYLKDYRDPTIPDDVGDPAPRTVDSGQGVRREAELQRPAGRISSAFGFRRDPIDGHRRFHAGVDIAAPIGTPIQAYREGTVTRAGRRGGYGLAIEVAHDDGTSSIYAHASALLVRKGDRIEKGDVLAKVGATGRATGPHLHFEIRREGKAINPVRALNAYGVRADGLVAGRPQSPQKEMSNEDP